MADARTREALGKVVDMLRALPRWLGVIDGVGNRSEMDRKLYSLANLVLLPFRDSHEDMRTLISDLETFPRAWAIPSQWPTRFWICWRLPARRQPMNQRMRVRAQGQTRAKQPHHRPRKLSIPPLTPQPAALPGTNCVIAFRVGAETGRWPPHDLQRPACGISSRHGLLPCPPSAPAGRRSPGWTCLP